MCERCFSTGLNHLPLSQEPVNVRGVRVLEILEKNQSILSFRLSFRDTQILNQSKPWENGAANTQPLMLVRWKRCESETCSSSWPDDLFMLISYTLQYETKIRCLSFTLRSIFRLKTLVFLICLQVFLLQTSCLALSTLLDLRYLLCFILY